MDTKSEDETFALNNITLEPGESTTITLGYGTYNVHSLAGTDEGANSSEVVLEAETGPLEISQSKCCFVILNEHIKVIEDY